LGVCHILMGIGSSTSRNSIGVKDSSSNNDERYYGLENFGNTCYCNSVLQSLYYITSFRNELLEFYSTQVRPSHPDDWTLLYCLADLFSQLSSPNSVASTIIPPSPQNARNRAKPVQKYLSPKIFVSCLKQANVLFQGFTQQDAHEFLNFLMNDITDKLIEIKKKQKEDKDRPPPTTGKRGVSPFGRLRLPNSRTDEPASERPALDKKKKTKGGTPDKGAEKATEGTETPLKEQDKLSDQEQSPNFQDLPAQQRPKTKYEEMDASSEDQRPSKKRDASQKDSETSSDNDEQKDEKEKPVRTWVHSLFEGLLTNEIRCLCCESITEMEEPFFDLSLEISPHTSVQACLKQFSKTEMLARSNKFHCDKCHTLQEAEKRMKIKRLPKVLILHLKRFKYDERLQGFVKLSYPINFPFQLKVPTQQRNWRKKQTIECTN